MKHNPATLANLAASPDPVTRLRSLRLMRYQIEAGQPPADYLDLARLLISDADHDCRWQALLVVGLSMQSDPEPVWQVVCEFGASTDEDMRDAIATILLENLLDQDFSEFFPRLQGCIENGSALLADTLSRCGEIGQSGQRCRLFEGVRKPVTSMHEDLAARPGEPSRLS